MKKALIILVLTCLFSHGIFAQTQFVDFPTPNASDLGKFGQIPVGYFNGLPDISIPIYTIKLREIQIPISLRYNAGGIKPEDHPGWTGIGWTLDAGGTITRIIKGRKDETTKQDIMSESGIGFTDDKFGYYYSCPELDVSNWSSESFLTKYVSHSFSNMYYKDTEPDEFIFNVAGMSGSFYFTMENGVRKVKIKSKQNDNLKIEESLSSGDFQIADEFPEVSNFKDFDPSALNIKKTFWSFTLTDGKGIKYIFGGNANSIDFTSTAGNTAPTSWNLTSIITPGKDTIKYEYKKEGNVVINRNQKNFYASYLKGNNSPYNIFNNISNDDNLLMQHPAYLTKIIASNGNYIEFSTSITRDLKYVYTDIALENFASRFFNLSKNYRTNFLKTNYWLQLDSITIKNLKNINFIYTNTENQRLRMSEVKFSYPSSQTAVQSYKFKYNTNYLPVYNSKQTDHWGYYNGKNYGNTSYDNLSSYRTPDGTLMKAESLEKIYYPTGGVSIFEYEPHTYSRIALQYDPTTPFSIKNETGTAGGLRIKKITTQEKEGSTAGQMVKEYIYQNADGSSSGILSGKPVYVAEGKNHVKYRTEEWVGLVYFKSSADYTQYYYQGSEQLLNPLSNTNGSHVTYSQVKEKFSDGSSSTYTYTNHDKFMDEPPVSIYNNVDSKTINEPFISKELERGLLVSTAHRNSQNVLLDSIYYEYNKNPNRYDNYIKSIVTKRLTGIQSVEFTRLSALKIYTFYPYLEKTIHYTYDSNGGNPVKVETSYKYKDTNYLLEKLTVKTSPNDSISTIYKYPSDFSSTYPYNEMVSKNILSPVIEKSEYKNGTTLLKKERTNYKSWYSSFYAPVYQEFQNGTGPMEARVFYSYDAKANVRDIFKDDDAEKVIYLWGYNYQYPIAEIKNATYDQIKNAINGQEATINRLTSNPVPSSTDLEALNNLRNAPSMVNTLITTYTYKPLVGIETMTDPRGVKTKYEYDAFGRLVTVKDHNDKAVNKYEYNYKQ